MQHTDLPVHATLSSLEEQLASVEPAYLKAMSPWGVLLIVLCVGVYVLGKPHLEPGDFEQAKVVSLVVAGLVTLHWLIPMPLAFRRDVQVRRDHLRHLAQREDAGSLAADIQEQALEHLLDTAGLVRPALWRIDRERAFEVLKELFPFTSPSQRSAYLVAMAWAKDADVFRQTVLTSTSMGEASRWRSLARRYEVIQGLSWTLSWAWLTLSLGAAAFILGKHWWAGASGMPSMLEVLWVLFLTVGLGLGGAFRWSQTRHRSAQAVEAALTVVSLRVA